jgi:hypothetical protein
MNQLHDTLRAAMLLEAVPNVLSTLLAIAEKCAEAGDSARAVGILVLIVRYPMHEDLRFEAESLYEEVAARVYPHVILDATIRADEITLEDMVTEILRADAT